MHLSWCWQKIRTHRHTISLSHTLHTHTLQGFMRWIPGDPYWKTSVWRLKKQKQTSQTRGERWKYLISLAKHATFSKNEILISLIYGDTYIYAYNSENDNIICSLNVFVWKWSTNLLWISKRCSSKSTHTIPLRQRNEYETDTGATVLWEHSEGSLIKFQPSSAAGAARLTPWPLKNACHLECSPVRELRVTQALMEHPFSLSCESFSHFVPY